MAGILFLTKGGRGDGQRCNGTRKTTANQLDYTRNKEPMVAMIMQTDKEVDITTHLFAERVVMFIEIVRWKIVR